MIRSLIQPSTVPLLQQIASSTRSGTRPSQKILPELASRVQDP